MGVFHIFKIVQMVPNRAKHNNVRQSQIDLFSLAFYLQNNISHWFTDSHDLLAKANFSETHKPLETHLRHQSISEQCKSAWKIFGDFFVIRGLEMKLLKTPMITTQNSNCFFLLQFLLLCFHLTSSFLL